MELLVICCAFGLLFGFSQSLNLDETSAKCAESCLKINPYNSILNTTVHHCAKLTADNKCECDWEKVLNAEGICECRNPHQKINPHTYECVCDLEKCKNMEHCMGIVTKDPYGCCPHYCEECPDDSYPGSDNKCSCYPCKKINCKANQTAVILKRGEMQPGKCCDLYKCEDMNRTCKTSTGIYPNGYTWISTETCEKCVCKNGIMFCDSFQEDCTIKNESSTCLGVNVEGAKVYQDGDTWMRDSCTKCVCENGQSRCFPHFCEDLPSVTIRPTLNPDCPSLASCKKTCVFGFKFSKGGCEICKCKMPDSKWIVQLMKKYNCTLENCDLKMAVTSNCNQNTSGESDQQKTADHYSHIPYIVVIVFLGALVLLLACLLCRTRRRGDLSLAQFSTGVMPAVGARPQYVTVPVFSDPPAKIIKPSVEMKSFH